MKKFDKVACWGEDNLHLIWHALTYGKSEDLSYFGNFLNYNEYSYKQKVKDFIENLNSLELEMTNLDFDYNLFKEQEANGGLLPITMTKC